MSRQLASKAEITKMINGRLSEGKELDGACRDVRVSGVRRHPPDESGCNWNWGVYNGPAECYEVVFAIVSDLRRQYNLNDG
jgi:hypothetical protein